MLDGHPLCAAQRVKMSSSTTGPPHKKRRYVDSSPINGALGNDDSFGTQSLPVATLPDDFSGDPLDGEPYLAVVRREALTAPGIFFAEHNPYDSPTAEEASIETPLLSTTWTTGSKEEALLMPTLEWRSAFELQFKNAREALSNPPTSPVKLTKDDLPKVGNSSAWYAWMHGRPPPPLSPEEAEKQSRKGHTWKLREPSAALLLRLSTEQILGLLEAFPYWLAHRVAIPDSQQSKTGGEKGGREVVQPLHARWMFALLLRLDGRLVSEEISTLRTLARACVAAITLSRIRRKAVRSRNKADQTEQQQEEQQSMRRDETGAWMIVTIIASVWGQSDLWDDAAVDMKRVT